jgi:hypothetical protein
VHSIVTLFSGANSEQKTGCLIQAGESNSQQDNAKHDNTGRETDALERVNGIADRMGLPRVRSIWGPGGRFQFPTYYPEAEQARRPEVEQAPRPDPVFEQTLRDTGARGYTHCGYYVEKGGGCD